LYTVTNELIIEEIHNKIAEFEGQVVEAENTIDQSQVAFNAIAEENITVQQNRIEELAAIEKAANLTNARA